MSVENGMTRVLFDLVGAQHLAARRVIVIADSRLSSPEAVRLDLDGQDERTHVE
jgi:hypothetical protein